MHTYLLVGAQNDLRFRQDYSMGGNGWVVSCRFDVAVRVVSARSMDVKGKQIVMVVTIFDLGSTLEDDISSQTKYV